MKINNYTQKFNTGYFLIIIYSIILKLLFIPTGLSDLQGYQMGVLVFNYVDYGFIKRSLPGTIVKLISYIYPNIYSYNSFYIIYTLLTIMFTIMLYLLIKTVLDKADNKLFVYQYGLIASAFLLISYWNVTLFGMPDIILLSLVILEVLLILKEKHEWLIIPITLICVLIHEGFACMQMPVTIVLLMWRYRNTKNKKYLWIWITHMMITLVVGVYLLKVVPYTEELYNQSLTLSKQIGNGVYYPGILAQVLHMPSDMATQLNVDPNFEGYLKSGRRQIIPFLILCFPYVYTWIRSSNKRINTLSIIGILLMVPMFILFCDYGRYFTYIIFYLLCLVLTLLYFEDKKIEEFSNNCTQSRNQILEFKWLILWTIMINPLLCFHINFITVYFDLLVN